MEKTWVVVEFPNLATGDVDVSAVPSSWIIDAGETLKCYYPDQSQMNSWFIKRYIRNHEKPNVSWPKYECRILSCTETGQYEEAMDLEKAAIETTDSDVCKPRGRGLRKKRPSNRMEEWDETRSSEPKERNKCGRDVSPPPTYVEPCDAHESGNSYDYVPESPVIILPDESMELNVAEEQREQREPAEQREQSCTCHHGSIAEKLDIILSKLSKLEMQMQSQEDAVKMIMVNHGNVASQPTVDFGLEETFPIKSMEEFRKLECAMESDEVFRKKVVESLRIQGGNTLGKAIYNMLYFAVADEVGEKFTFKGQKKDKEGFCSTHLCTAMFKAVRSRTLFQSTEKTAFQEFAGEWFRQSSYRLRKMKCNSGDKL